MARVLNYRIIIYKGCLKVCVLGGGAVVGVSGDPFFLDLSLSSPHTYAIIGTIKSSRRRDVLHQTFTFDIYK